jgi:hypothetical protein
VKALLFLCGLLNFAPHLVAAQSPAYTAAYATLRAMLTGKQRGDFQHAVFVVENAWFGNTLNEAQFNQQISSVAQACQRMVRQKNLQQHPTAGNWAIFMWMTQKVPENDNQPLRYDFEDFTGKSNFANTFVTRAIQDHKGNCLSLPLLYKCLAQQIGVEARLTLGPSHAWIRHLDEDGKWANVELTSGQLPSDGLMMTELGISTEAIKSGAYFKPLTEQEALAFLLTQLALGYEHKFGRLDAFTERCTDLSLTYFRPNVVAYMLKANYLAHKAQKLLASKKATRAELDVLHRQYVAYQTKLRTLGANTLSAQTYTQWVSSMQARPTK